MSEEVLEKIVILLESIDRRIPIKISVLASDDVKVAIEKALEPVAKTLVGIKGEVKAIRKILQKVHDMGHMVSND